MGDIVRQRARERSTRLSHVENGNWPEWLPRERWRLDSRSLRLLPIRSRLRAHGTLQSIARSRRTGRILGSRIWISRIIEKQGYIVLDDIWVPSARHVASFIRANRTCPGTPRLFLASLD